MGNLSNGGTAYQARILNPVKHLRCFDRDLIILIIDLRVDI